MRSWQSDSTDKKAARLGYGLVKDHPFVDGNKRIGAHAMLVFLALNGVGMDYTQGELSDTFVLLIPQILNFITERYSWDEVTAHKVFYNSRVYALLEQEDTKLWHLSALTLFHMFDEERQTGTLTFPEEA